MDIIYVILIVVVIAVMGWFAYKYVSLPGLTLYDNDLNESDFIAPEWH